MNYVEYADDEHWQEHLRQPCVNCGDDYADFCEACGLPLCVMCSEGGGGFCRDCPTPDYAPEVQP